MVEEEGKGKDEDREVVEEEVIADECRGAEGERE
jgi:hypothetical protein